MHNNWKDQLNFLLYNKPSLTIISIYSLTLLPGPIQKTHFSTTFKTILVYLACKRSRISTWFITNYTKFARFTKLPKYRPTKQISKLFSNGNYFSKCTKLHRYKWTPVKITSTKYGEILTFTSWPRLVNVYMY